MGAHTNPPLGANPRQQFLAQFSGIFVGTVVSVLTFTVLVPDAQVLGTDQFPAPESHRSHRTLLKSLKDLATSIGSRRTGAPRARKDEQSG